MEEKTEYENLKKIMTMAKQNPDYEEFKEFLEDNELRICSVCGKVMSKGYYLDGEYACSAKCRNKIMSKDDYYAEAEEESSDYYYTEWENILGVDVPALNKALDECMKIKIANNKEK